MATDVPEEAWVEVSLAQRVIEHARINPERIAIECDGSAISYSALLVSASSCAATLRDIGLLPGGSRRVGLLASNSLDFAIIVLACQLAGVAIVPLPGLITAEAMAGMLDDAGIAVLFADAKHDALARAALAASLGCGDVPVVRIGDVGALAAWSASSAAVFAPVDIDADWQSDLIYSSGTTGTPKGIAQSYGSRRAQCLSLGALGINSDTGLLHTVGLYSNFGLSALLLSNWWGGAFYTMAKFSGIAVVDLVRRGEVDMAWFAPATLLRTVEAPGFALGVRDRSCVKLCAGAPLSIEQKTHVLKSWPGSFYDIYGQTETGTLTMLAMHAAPATKLKSVGTVLPSAQVRIIDDEGTLLALGEEGEIAGHSTTLMAGYHARDDANSAAHWRDDEGRLYVRTGDVGRIDEDGYLWLCDRKKDMIISGGFNVYPADIERVLVAHPAVFEAAVIGCASHRWGETPVAFVTLREGATAEEEDLRSWSMSALVRCSVSPHCGYSLSCRTERWARS
jgi:long-chain acyl-CoA synthetase